MLPADKIPDSPAEEHFNICQAAAVFLGRLADGNGLKPNQLRLARHDTAVHQLPASVTVADP